MQIMFVQGSSVSSKEKKTGGGGVGGGGVGDVLLWPTWSEIVVSKKRKKTPIKGEMGAQQYIESCASEYQ